MSKSHSTNKNKTGNNSDKDFSCWEWEDVNNWLINNNIENYVDNFKTFEINGYDLCYMTNEDFNEIKLTNFHDRNLILKKIRLMTLEQLKMQIIYEDKCYTIQLEFDPNFTIENLTNSIIDLLKIQNNVIYLGTLDNEILIPNLKIVDLIFLNPAKYKKLKVLTANSNFSLNSSEEKIEKNFTSKRYDVLQSASDYMEDKSKVNYENYQYNEEPNLKTSNVSEYNLSNDKNFEQANDNKAEEFKYRAEVLNVGKDKELTQQKMNYLKSKNQSIYDDDYYGRDKTSYEDYSGYNNKSTMEVNKEVINTSNNINLITNPPSSNTNLKPNSKNANFNSYDYNKYYEKDSNYSKPSAKLNTVANKYEFGTNSDVETKINSTNPSNHYNNKYINYAENSNEISSNVKDTSDKGRIKIERDGSSLNSNTFNDKFEKNSNKKEINEDRNVIGSLATTPNEYNTVKYNYSERIRDDLNKQRFSSEKRNFRANPYSGKNEEKSSDLENASDSKIKYEKYNEDYVDNLKYKYNDELDSFYEKEPFKSTKETINPANVNIMDIKSKINSIRSQVNSNVSLDRKVTDKNSGFERDNPELENRKIGRSNIPLQSGYSKSKI